MAKNLLINEPPLQVLPSLAKAIGLNEAMVVQQLHYWLENPKTGVDRNGFKWVFNTYEEWRENFPFWSISTIKRIFLNLEKLGVIISDQLDKEDWDMRKYYRLAYDQLDTMHGVNLSQSNGSKWDNDNKGTTETTSEINKAVSEKGGIDWKIANDLPITEDDLTTEKLKKEAPLMFEKALGFGQLPWWSNHAWEKFGKFVCEIYRQDPFAFGNFQIWRGGEGKYSAMSNKQIRTTPLAFMDTGWPEYLSSKKIKSSSISERL